MSTSTLQQTAHSRSFTVVRAWPTWCAAACCLVSFAAFWAAQRTADVSMIDLMVYRAEGWTVRTGQDLYSMRATSAELPATYPPFAALLFMPLTLIGTGTMRTAATALNLLLLVAFVQLCLRLLGRPLRVPRPAAALALASLAVWCEPVWTTLRYGQVNLLLAVLVLWDLTRRDGHRWAGAGIGIAAGIKLTPALFAVFLLLAGAAQACARRRAGDVTGNPMLRQSALATGTFAGTVLLSAVLLPRDSWRFWTDAVFRSDRVGHTEITDNQSLRGVLARLLHDGDPGLSWAVLAAAVTVFGLGTAVAATRSGSGGARGRAVVACAVTALLISPVSWSHHWVWCVPLVLVLGAEAAERGGAHRWTACGLAALAFCSYALWWVPHGSPIPPAPELHQGAGEMLLSAVYPVAGCVFLAWTAASAAGTLRRGATP